MPLKDAEEEVEGEVEEVVEKVTTGAMLIGPLDVRGMKISTVSVASVLEGVGSSDEELSTEEFDSSDEELPVEVGTGSLLDSTLPHGSSPKAWPVQPHLERQELTQFAPPQRTCFSGCCSELFESLLES